jgi:hypothetical protein
MDNVRNESKTCAFLILYFLLHLSDSTVQAMMYTTVKVRKSGLFRDWVDLDFLDSQAVLLKLKFKIE